MKHEIALIFCVILDIIFSLCYIKAISGHISEISQTKTGLLSKAQRFMKHCSHSFISSFLLVRVANLRDQLEFELNL